LKHEYAHLKCLPGHVVLRDSKITILLAPCDGTSGPS
jgi:hypothetical protein